MSVVRHFTATGFVIHNDSALLHWHRKVRMWLPPGGHIEPNEDPVQAVLREIQEETGVQAEVVPTSAAPSLDYPKHVHAPVAIMIEDIDDPAQGYHQHIDMIYFCKPVGSPTRVNAGWLWVSRRDLADGMPLRTADGAAIVPPDDVRVLAARAFEVVGGMQA